MVIFGVITGHMVHMYSPQINNQTWEGGYQYWYKNN